MVSLTQADADSTVIASAARPAAQGGDFDPLIASAGNRAFVLIGEASHGTHEFYATRADLTRRLVAEKNFRIIALEADWPDMLRVHRYVTGRSEDNGAAEALGDFRRFPAWMWRNTVVVEFVEWLRRWNSQQPERDRAGIFGMDLYSLHSSIEAVLRYLEKVDPDAAKRARHRYACFEFFGPDPQTYGYATTSGQIESCEDDVVAQLIELRRKYGELMSGDGNVAADEFFYAEQNARLVANAERYYRSMFRGRDTSWNLRDEHMGQTLQALVNHFDSGRSKVVVWAHNSHLGDARATEMGARGEWNVGQLTRERYGDNVFSIGFSTNSGTVTAASDWGGTAERKRVRPALAGSYERLFHEAGTGWFWIDLRATNDAVKLLRQRRLERAIGVIYRPDAERWSHYFEACLPDQFDAIIHLDETRALEPLERSSEWDRGELPETYPEGL
ncbi:MAG: erythromycin esterase [Verrucomicrobia bacterium]|nr:MAG: erythromycin esterase [Verrucomicrobiota bacterium]